MTRVVHLPYTVEHVLRHGDGRGTTVTVHQGRDLAEGTLRNILVDAGLTVEELKRLI